MYNNVAILATKNTKTAAPKPASSPNSELKNIPKIYVTATYNKPSKVYGITEESTLIWDLKDIKDNKIFTPPLSLGILPGTTRNLILKLCCLAS